MNLQIPLQDVEVRRAGSTSSLAPAVPTGFPQLDALLPGGGWPLGALTEIMIPRDCTRELQLLLPALARLSRSNRWLALMAPPHVPEACTLAAAQVDLTRVLLVHPRANADGLQAVERSLRAGTCSVVVAWPAALDTSAARRLQQAAETGGTCGLLFRPQRTAKGVSSAALCLRLTPTPAGVDVWVLRPRDGLWNGPVSLDFRLSQALPGRESSLLCTHESHYWPSHA